MELKKIVGAIILAIGLLFLALICWQILQFIIVGSVQWILWNYIIPEIIIALIFIIIGTYFFLQRKPKIQEILIIAGILEILWALSFSYNDIADAPISQSGVVWPAFAVLSIPGIILILVGLYFFLKNKH